MPPKADPTFDACSPERVADAVAFLMSQVTDPRKGLPEALFLLASRLTPLVNVDLLIRNELGEVLLTWRHDAIFGKGWHVPGGCIRLGETFADRINAVAVNELGAAVTFAPTPLGVFETVDKTRTSRTHHVTLLFNCVLVGKPDPQRKHIGALPKPGYWKWHSKCPIDLLQREYRDRFGNLNMSESFVDGCESLVHV
jgi:colanic acid biosynthesis protein WcaH